MKTPLSMLTASFILAAPAQATHLLAGQPAARLLADPVAGKARAAGESGDTRLSLDIQWLGQPDTAPSNFLLGEIYSGQ